MSNFPIQIPVPIHPPIPPVLAARPPQIPGVVPSGQAGLNAYQLAVLGAAGVAPFAGTMAEWLLSLIGDPGAPGDDAIANLSTDPALGISDVLAPSQAAVKSYVDAEASRATQAEAALGGAISQEGQDRADALAALQAEVDAIEGLLASNDVTLDQLQEIVTYIKANRADLDALGIGSILGLGDALAGLGVSISNEVTRAADAEQAITAGLGTITPKNYTQSSTAPENPNPGDQWLRDTTGQKFERYDGFWVEIGAGALTAAALQTVINNGNYTFGGKLTAGGQGTYTALTSGDVVTKALLIDLLMDSAVWDYHWSGFTTAVIGGAGTIYADGSRIEYLKLSGVYPYLFYMRGTATGTNFMPNRAGVSSNNVNYSSYFEVSGLFCTSSNNTNTQQCVELWRGTLSGAPTYALARKGIRMEVKNFEVRLHLFNTTLNVSAVIYTATVGVAFSYRIINYGDGTVGLSINRGTPVVVSGGPVGLGATYDNNIFVVGCNSVDTSAVAGTYSQFSLGPARVYWP